MSDSERAPEKDDDLSILDPDSMSDNRFRYRACRSPGTLKPGVWGDDDTRISHYCEHRTMWGARLCAWILNRKSAR